jgi:hypothetical protein
LDDLTVGDLAIEIVSAPPEPICCWWRGKSNDRQPSRVLTPYLAELLDRADGESVSLEMHFENLDHFNSSTITVLIELIQGAQERGVPLTLFYDRGLKWQKLSFNALRVFDRDDGMFALRAT